MFFLQRKLKSRLRTTLLAPMTVKFESESSHLSCGLSVGDAMATSPMRSPKAISSFDIDGSPRSFTDDHRERHKGNDSAASPKALHRSLTTVTRGEHIRSAEFAAGPALHRSCTTVTRSHHTRSPESSPKGATPHRFATFTSGAGHTHGKAEQSAAEAEPSDPHVDAPILWPEAITSAKRWKAAEQSGDRVGVLKAKSEFLGKLLSPMLEEG